MTLEGDWSLSISPVKLEDEAEYQCQVGGAGDPSDAIRSVSASNFHSTNLLICQRKSFPSVSFLSSYNHYKYSFIFFYYFSILLGKTLSLGALIILINIANLRCSMKYSVLKKCPDQV